jgi:hypothetical protein
MVQTASLIHDKLFFIVSFLKGMGKNALQAGDLPACATAQSARAAWHSAYTRRSSLDQIWKIRAKKHTLLITVVG